MKFYSEYTKQIYDTMELCDKAEKDYLEEKNRKANAENEAKANLDKLFQSFNEKNETVKKANAELSTANRALQEAVNNFGRKYGYVPDKYRSIQFLTWLL
jgi:septal ring factor EnvC (AmiA/AmiB activator)